MSHLTDEQWTRIAPLLPPPPRMGRPRADDRKTLEGILYVLRTGCRWKDVPREYGTPVTLWRRFRAWEANGTWERVWRGLLSSLDAESKQQWTQAFLDGSFVPTKTGDSKERRVVRASEEDE